MFVLTLKGFKSAFLLLLGACIISLQNHRAIMLHSKISHKHVFRLLRASPPVLSKWLQTVKCIVKKSKCAGLAQEIGFSAPNTCSLPWLVNGATQLCTSKKKSVINWTWLWLNISDWSMWFAISSSLVYSSYSLIGGVAQRKTAKLRHFILLSKMSISGDALTTSCLRFFIPSRGLNLKPMDRL